MTPSAWSTSGSSAGELCSSTSVRPPERASRRPYFQRLVDAYREEALPALEEYEFIPAYRGLAVAWRLRVAGWYGLWQDSTGRREETYGLLDGVGGRPMRARAGC